MLTVLRRIRQSIVVDEIEGFERMLKITVLEVRGEEVRLGLEVMADDSGADAQAWDSLDQFARAGRSQRSRPAHIAVSSLA